MGKTISFLEEVIVNEEDIITDRESCPKNCIESEKVDPEAPTRDEITVNGNAVDNLYDTWMVVDNQRRQATRMLCGGCKNFPEPSETSGSRFVVLVDDNEVPSLNVVTDGPIAKEPT
ncbi:hypothetical protein V6N13_037372 [Hibiscus sabdariffa]|uniref:Uncharacterized protein n=1 Tax=Hibiscus sabdariffa TaxID=183260 RepID=A0ABR2E933_9ROSI